MMRARFQREDATLQTLERYRARFELLRQAVRAVIPDLEDNLEIITQCFQNSKGGYDSLEDQEQVKSHAARLLRLKQALKE